jgi:hypothetical protein
MDIYVWDLLACCFQVYFYLAMDGLRAARVHALQREFLNSNKIRLSTLSLILSWFLSSAWFLGH